MMTIEKKYNYETSNLSIKKIDTDHFVFLVSVLSNNPPSKIISRELKLPNDFTGNILIDTLLHSGNNSSRFMEYKVNCGEIDFATKKVISLERLDIERVQANKNLSNFPTIIQYSIINEAQKKLLINGISI